MQDDVARHLKDIERLKTTGNELAEHQGDLKATIDKTVGR